MAGPVDDHPLPESARTREKGNGLYKARKLVLAEARYMEAARLAPQDPRPLSNVAAVKFKMGNYVGAAIFSEKALKLLGTHSDEALEQKLRVRLAKAYFYCGKHAQCKLVCNIARNEEGSSLDRSLSSTEALDGLLPNVTHLWEQVLDRLPRYKPSFENESEYFSVGNYGAQQEFTLDLAALSQESYSFLFCGIGDARNLFATLASISLNSECDPSLSSKKFYFTLLDERPSIFARDLLIFRMLDDCSMEHPVQKEETLVTISYCFGAQVMPAWTYERLQKAIKDLLSELKNRNSDILGRFGVDRETREAISHHLRKWQQTPQDWYSTASILGLTRQQNMDRRAQNMATYGKDYSSSAHSPPGCESGSPHVLGYNDCNIMLPFIHHVEKHEPQLLKLYKEKGDTSASERKLDQYFEEKWKPNITLIDFDWEENRDKPRVLLSFFPAQVISQLFAHIPTAVLGQDVRGILSHFVGFFDFIAACSSKIKQQTVFEIVVDETISFLERANHGLLQRDLRFASNSPSAFPDQYDRIQMSNIPDYIGGPLSTFLYGLPALRSGDSSTMTSNCLRNPRNWVIHDQFLYEYLLLADRKVIKDTFGASLSSRSRQLEEEMDGVQINGKGAIMVHRLSWTRATSSQLAWSELMPRQQLKRWLFAHFLKICLPSQQPKWDNDLVQVIYAPLNLTIFFRLIAHLSKTGYPSHWLSGVLDLICSGNITTRARAPRSMIGEISCPYHKHGFPNRTMSIKPFLAEFTTLLAIFRNLLPFGILLSQVTLPRLDVIHEYTLSYKPNGIFKYRDLEIGFAAIFILGFCHKSKLDRVPTDNLRAALLDDEDADPVYKVVHAGLGQESPIHVISTWTWNSKASIMSFWLAQTIVDDIMAHADDWEAYVWRSDTWTAALGPLPVDSDTLVRGRSWC